jgi:hypothetical protein
MFKDIQKAQRKTITDTDAIDTTEKNAHSKNKAVYKQEPGIPL